MPEPSGSSHGQHSFLCFDFGLKRIGVAVGQRVSGTASALETVLRQGKDAHWARIEQLLQSWQPDALVVGVPLTEDGGEQDMTRSARRFARQLHGRFGLPVFEADERYTSRIAEERFRQQRAAGAVRRKDRDKEDALAAQVILESWFDANPA